MNAARRRGPSRGRRREAVRPLARHVLPTLPWGPLLAGCGAGTLAGLATARLAGPLQHPAAVLTGVRAAFVPVVTGLAFLLHDPNRQLTGALPVPAWLIPTLRVTAVLPVLGLVCWLQLHLGAVALSADLRGTGAAAPGLPTLAMAGEFAAMCSVALAASAAVARTRWQELGGAAAAPGAIAVLGSLAVAPLGLLPTQFTGMTAAQRHAWARAWHEWALIGALALALAWWSARDPWHRVGVLRKRTVPARTSSLAVWAGLDLAAVFYLRQHYQAPITRKSPSPDPGNSWVLSQWWAGPNGHPASQSTIRILSVEAQQAGGQTATHQGLAHWFAQHGYWLWSSYQPQSRYWHFQLIEGGWLLVLSVIALAATIWLVRPLQRVSKRDPGDHRRRALSRDPQYPPFRYGLGHLAPAPQRARRDRRAAGCHH
ncbi:MAG TPA: hypothetical protein VGS19_00310 [Streptosporangiaceae bacterium]|nr:hypothetical protein [Streptosporangiaceae bacterium]